MAAQRSRDPVNVLAQSDKVLARALWERYGKREIKERFFCRALGSRTWAPKTGSLAFLLSLGYNG